MLQNMDKSLHNALVLMFLLYVHVSVWLSLWLSKYYYHFILLHTIQTIQYDMHHPWSSKDTNAYFFKSSRGHIWHNDFSLRLVLLSAVHDLQSCSVIINLANTITNHPPTFSSAQLMIMNIRHDILSVRSIATHQMKWFTDTEQWVLSNKRTHTIKLCPNILL